jgi:hypothetical protein
MSAETMLRRKTRKLYGRRWCPSVPPMRKSSPAVPVRVPLQFPAQGFEHRFGESGADPADVAQSVLVGDTQQ